jgi:nicotinamide-nucleotide amidase
MCLRNGYNAAMTDDTQQLVVQLAEQLSSRGEKVTTAESCTGGLIAKTFTDLAGSSVWFDRGFVTYSNEAKTEMISVPASVIEQYGAVSEPVVNAMVTGALKHSAADYAIAVTGVAGPGGGSAEKPVGTVWIGVGSKHQLIARKYVFPGDRAAVRQATLETALGNLESMLEIGEF